MLQDGVKNYYEDEKSQTFMDSIQTYFQCCGVNDGGDDYLPNDPPETCHQDDLLKPCQSQFYEWIESKLFVVAFVAIGISVVMILGMIFSMVLCCAIRDTVA